LEPDHHWFWKFREVEKKKSACLDPMKLFKSILDDPVVESEAAVVIDVCRAFTTAAYAFLQVHKKLSLSGLSRKPSI